MARSPSKLVWLPRVNVYNECEREAMRETEQTWQVWPMIVVHAFMTSHMRSTGKKIEFDRPAVFTFWNLTAASCKV